jgi:hypothetical protein
MKMVNYMLDLAFTIELPEDPYGTLDRIPSHMLVNAMQKRVDYLRNHLDEVQDAVGMCDSYTFEMEETK